MPRRPSQTRQRVLDAAIGLFNDRGAGTVTTHDSAKACAISPGNLYYHLRNKEEIVRALFDEAIARHRSRLGPGRWSAASRPREGQPPDD